MAFVLALILVAVPQSLGWDYFKGGDDWPGICVTGKQQSPIDLKDSILTKIKPSDGIMGVNVSLIGQFTGTAVKGVGQSITISGSQYGVIQINNLNVSIINFHYHSPSESTVNEQYFDIELHLVGLDQNYKIYEISVLFKVNQNPNQFVQASIDSYKNGGSAVFNTNWLHSNGALSSFYFYNGSSSAPLSTSDCAENVGWLVFGGYLEISQSQLDFFSGLYKSNASYAGGRGNNRNIQSLNGRTVYYYTSNGHLLSLACSFVLLMVQVI